jgi:VWFA-related protein
LGQKRDAPKLHVLYNVTCVIITLQLANISTALRDGNKMRRKHFFAITLVILIGVIALQAQNIPEDEYSWGSRAYILPDANALRVQTDLVEVPVVIRDSHGNVVTGLQKSDFVIYDNGKPQTISSFSVETHTHLTTQPVSISQPGLVAPTGPLVTVPAQIRYVAFYFDDTNMPLGDLVSSRDAAKKFVRENLDPGDKVGIFTSSTTVSLNFTDNRQALVDTLAQIRTHWKRPSSICPKMRAYQAYLIEQFYNTPTEAAAVGMAECPTCTGDFHCILNAAQETLALSDNFAQDTMGILNDVIRYLGRMPGQRMLLFTSSGFMTLKLGPQQDKLIAAAIRNKVVINSLDAKGLVADGDFSDGPPVALRDRLAAARDSLMSQQRDVFNDPLTLLAEGTGGKFFHNNNDMLHGIRDLAAIPEVSYVLGFSPENLKINGSQHGLKVKVPNHSGVTIEARTEYFAPSPELTPTEKKFQKLNHEVLATDAPTEFPSQLKVEPEVLPSGLPVLRVSIHVDVSKMPFQKIAERKVERLIFITALFDSRDHFVTGVQGVMDLRLKDPTLATLAGTGVTAKLTLDAPAGQYRLRQVVQETANGRLSVQSQLLQIH